MGGVEGDGSGEGSGVSERGEVVVMGIRFLMGGVEGDVVMIVGKGGWQAHGVIGKGEE